MLSSTILKNCIEELHTITKVSLSIYDYTGIELVSMGEHVAVDADAIRAFVNSPADSQTIKDANLFKVYDEEELAYVLLSEGEDAFVIGRVAVSQLKQLLVAYKERYDRNNFFQNLIMDNLLLVDVYNRAKKLHIETDVPRVIYIVEVNGDKDADVTALLRSLFTVENGDYITEVDEKNVIVIKALSDTQDYEYIYQLAQTIVDTINAEAYVNVRVGFGTVVNELKDVSRSYKEAMIAIDVGKIFNIERNVNAYSSLGIGRLIYQLPQNLCQMFIEEIFADNDPSLFDEEIISTIYKFFENNLNVSETARQLFIHRNTLVYRIEKLKALTNLDVRVFDDALTFTLGMMVYNYMKYLEAN